MIDYNLLKEYTEKCCYKQKVRIENIEFIGGEFIYTYRHEYNDSNQDSTEKVSFIELLNFLYNKMNELQQELKQYEQNN